MMKNRCSSVYSIIEDHIFLVLLGFELSMIIFEDLMWISIDQ